MWKKLRMTLRIAVTAVSLLVCGLLIVLWVRSYFHREFFGGPVSDSMILDSVSFDGVLDIGIVPNWVDVPYWWKHDIVSVDGLGKEKWSIKEFDSDGFAKFRAPHWFLVTIFAAIAALPWIKWRFSLRTLLILLTLFALFFGAIAISMRG